jgi:hypothetical protein
MTDIAFTTAELRALIEAHLALTRYANATKRVCIHHWPQNLGAGCPVCELRTADRWNELIDRARQSLGVIIALAVAGRISIVVAELAPVELSPESIAAMKKVIEGARG